MPNFDSQAYAQDLRELIPSAQAAWLYGSVAKGLAVQGSDVDVAVLLDARHPIDAWALSQQATQLAERWGKSVDLIDMRQAPCILQKEIIQARHRLFAHNPADVDGFELHALHQYRDYMERYAAEFAQIASTGKVMQSRVTEVLS